MEPRAEETTQEDGTIVPPRACRRDVVGAVSAGMLLAASGLLLPRLAIETTARGRADGASLGGRYGQDRRGRNKHRGHGNDKHPGNRRNRERDQAPGRVFRGIELSAVYTPPGQSLNASLWTIDRDFKAFELVTSQAVTSAGAILRTEEPDGYLWISDRYLVVCDNGIGYPTATLGFGGTFGRLGWFGGTFVIKERSLSENELAPQMNADGHTFTLKRLTDSDDYKRFKLVIT